MQVTEYLLRCRAVWDRKPALRALYADVFERVAAVRGDGPGIEIGGGIGNLKASAPDVLTSDVHFAPWLDFVTNGESLPLAAGSVGTLVAIDMLHHMEEPRRLLAEAERVLRPGGRFIVVEPAITPGSWLFYKLHPESFDMSADPFGRVPRDFDAGPYDANQAIGTLLFVRHLARLRQDFPALRVLSRTWFRFFVYPLTGLFRPWSLLPGWAVRPLMRMEDALAPLLGRVLGFRMMVVMERTE